MGDVMDFAEKVAFYEEKLQKQIDACEALGELLADLERKVRRTALEYLNANPEAKKIALEKIEMLSAIGDQKKCDYLELVYLRHKAKMSERIFEATQAGLSGIQSMMKYQGRV